MSYYGSQEVFRPVKTRFRTALLLIVIIAALAACKRGGEKALESAYVSAPQVAMRDRVAAIYNKTGTLKNGERVEVMDKQKRFARVKSASGEIGWIEIKYLADEQTYKGFQQLAAEHRNDPVQAHATTRASLNVHLTPGRDTDHLYQLKESDKVEILQRGTAEKPASQAPRLPAKLIEKKGKTEAFEEPPAKPMEDWFLIRDTAGHVGWVLSRMLDLDVPLDIAQYSEGQRIVAYFILNTVHDPEAPPPATTLDPGTEAAEVKRGPRDVPQYLVLLSPPKDGEPYDFDQARIFTWNLKRHRYETAYRERKLAGVFPATSGTADFGKEGVEPVFTLRVKDDAGNVQEKKYRLIGPIVRRVMTPDEEAREKAERAARTARHPQKRRR